MVDGEVRGQHVQAGAGEQFLEVCHMVQTQVMEGDDGGSGDMTFLDNLASSMRSSNTDTLILTI